MKKFYFLLAFLFLTPVSIKSQNIVGWDKHKSPLTETWHNAFFISYSKGWAILHQTGLVLQTTDRGKTWIVQARLGEGYLESIFFTDEKSGWVCGEQGRLFKTSDGGKNWSLQNGFEETSALSAVYFFGKQHGFVFGSDVVTRKSLIFETHNNGKTWVNRSQEIDSVVSLTDAIYPLNKNTFFVGGRGYILRVGKSKEGLKIFDTKQSGTIRALFFQNLKIGWAVGHQGLVLKTNDGGENWEKKNSFTNTILRSIVFVDEKRGFIVGNRNDKGVSMWTTNDGGETWQEMNKDFSNLHRLVLAKKMLWLFGANGAIYSHSH